MQRNYSKLINIFELENNYFQREKILNKIFEIINTKPYYFSHKILKYFDDRALIKNFRFFFFLEISIFSMLYNSNINDFSDLYFAFKHCLFYLNQNLLILTHFIIDKLEHIEKCLKKDINFESYYIKSINYKEGNLNSSNNKNSTNNLNHLFKFNLMEKEYVRKCIAKLEENKTWLNKNYIFKNFNNNNKNIVNVFKNIIGIFLNIPNTPEDLIVVYYEIKDILNDMSKIKIEKNLEHFNDKV